METPLPVRPDADSDAALAALRAPLAGTERVHLNNAGIAPLAPAARQALLDLTELQCRGTLGIGETIARVEGARAALGRLVGVAPADVALFQTCAVALSQAAFGLPLRAGDEIVIVDQEYPSNAYPWYRAAERVGASVKLVASAPDFTIDPADVLAAIGPRTRVVACSWVQFQTGTTLDLPPLAEAVHRQGGYLVVDAIQGLGALPFDLLAAGADLVCGGSQKWLLGPLGLGFLAARPGLAADMTPIAYGAMTYGTPDDAPDPTRPMRATARRFEPGAPPALAGPATGASVQTLLDIGIDRVERENRALSDRLFEGLARRDYRVHPRSTRSAIVTFIPRQDPAELATSLRDQGATVAVRAGGLRVSPHVHNGPQHIDRFLNLLAELDR